MMKYKGIRTRIFAVAVISLCCAGLMMADSETDSDDRATGYENQLEPVAFLVGIFEGQGIHQWGTYDEELTGEWAQNKTLIIVRSKSRMQGQVIYEDLRIFSYDNAKKRIRMRQYAMGDLATYSVDVKEKDKTIVFNETEHEGQGRDEWRYTYTLKDDSSFSYQVDAKKDKKFTKYVKGDLKPQLPDISKPGTYTYKTYTTKIPRNEGDEMWAVVTYPEGEGPFPAIVFSPGSNASTSAGYGHFDQWFGSWGFISVCCAFNTPSVEKRAKQYSDALDWLVKENRREESEINGLVNVDKFVAAGHSSGGYASILAAKGDMRFAAALALTPSGPTQPVKGDNNAPICVIAGGADQQYLKASKAIWKNSKETCYLVTVKGMNHMMGPQQASQELISRATAFLKFSIEGDSRYLIAFTQNSDSASVVTPETNSEESSEEEFSCNLR